MAQPIRDQRGDYVLAVTQNQKHIHALRVEICVCERAENFAGCLHDYACTVVKDHGRIETRYFISGQPPLAQKLLAEVRGYWGIENSMY